MIEWISSLGSRPQIAVWCRVALIGAPALIRPPTPFTGLFIEMTAYVSRFGKRRSEDPVRHDV